MSFPEARSHNRSFPSPLVVASSVPLGLCDTLRGATERGGVAPPTWERSTSPATS